MKNVGRSLSVELVEGEKVEGELKEVKSDSIVIGKDDRELAFKEIKQSKVIVSFK